MGMPRDKGEGYKGGKKKGKALARVPPDPTKHVTPHGGFWGATADLS